MHDNGFRFRLGNFECLAILDTIDPINFEFIFPNIPGADMSNLVAQYNISNKFEISCLFVRTGKHNVLIDTGLGAGLRPNAGMLITNLQNMGIQRKDIDTVILSHAHPDHIGGNVNAELKPNFPNARYVMSIKEWEFVESKPDLKSLRDIVRRGIFATIQKNFVPIENIITTVGYETEIIPGVRFIDAPGHTPGHALLLVSSNSEQLLYAADIFHGVAQLARPEWSTAFDLVPEQAIKTRAQIINRARSTNALIFGSHFPYPPIGHIVEKNDAYVWKPL